MNHTKHTYISYNQYGPYCLKYSSYKDHIRTMLHFISSRKGVNLEEIFYETIQLNLQEDIIMAILGEGINFNQLLFDQGSIFMKSMETLSRAKMELGDVRYYAGIEQNLLKFVEKIFIEILVPFAESGGFDVGRFLPPTYHICNKLHFTC